MDDLLDLYYNKLKVPCELQDRKRDGGAFNHMLDKYRLSFVSSLDFIITMIKQAENDDMKATSPFDIEEYKQQAFEALQVIVAHKRPEIIWRSK